MKLTKEQLEIVKGLVELSGNMADHILKIMSNHGLDKLDGCSLTISVTPAMLFATENITFGTDNTETGVIRLAKGRRCKNEKFVPFGRNSPEYEVLFADESIRSRMEASISSEKPLPPDGLWISINNNDYPLDSGWN